MSDEHGQGQGLPPVHPVEATTVERDSHRGPGAPVSTGMVEGPATVLLDSAAAVADRARRAKERLTLYGQAHVLRFFDELPPASQVRLLDQVLALDLDRLHRVVTLEPKPQDPALLEPVREVVCPGSPEDGRALERGRAALAAGQIGVILVAGGQGTRLGFDGPKGAFPIGLLSGQSLFALHAERLLAAGRRYGVVPPLYLMTSADNHSSTLDFFEAHEAFGLPRDRVFVFQQGSMPALDMQGKLLLASPDSLVLAPDGNGGLFAALERSGALDHMARLGVETLSYIQVDNALARSCDPLFLGHHLVQDSHYSCKAIPKASPDEKVGVFALRRDRLCIVEYYELRQDMAVAKSSSGELLYGLSNPGLFAWSRAFLEAQARRRDLPLHRAHKKIPCLDADGRLHHPDEENGFKLEMFAMDTLPDAPRSLLMRVQRQAEFAPLKNARGADSPEQAQRQMADLVASWIREAGGTLARPDLRLEVSPLFAEDASELRARLPQGVRVEADLYLGDPNPPKPIKPT